MWFLGVCQHRKETIASKISGRNVLIERCSHCHHFFAYEPLRVGVITKGYIEVDAANLPLETVGHISSRIDFSGGQEPEPELVAA